MWFDVGKLWNEVNHSDACYSVCCMDTVMYSFATENEIQYDPFPTNSVFSIQSYRRDENSISYIEPNYWPNAGPNATR